MKKKSRRERIAESRIIEKEDNDSMVIPIVTLIILFALTGIYMFAPCFMAN